MEKSLFSEFDLSGKVALVTGGARGLGREYALTLAKYGADIVVCDILPEVENVKAEIERLGRRALTRRTDICKIPEIYATIEESVKVFGHIDILINNAGINIPQWAVDVTEEAWDHVIDLNLKGLFFCCQAVGKVMIRQKKGKIINVSSTMGSVGHDTEGSLFIEQGRGESPDQGAGDRMGPPSHQRERHCAHIR